MATTSELQLLRDLIDTLKEELGTLMTSEKFGTEYISIRFSDRYPIMMDVLKTLKEKHKKNKKFFRNPSVERVILDSFMPKHTIRNWTSEKIDNCKGAILGEFQRAVNNTWPEDPSKHVPKERKNNKKELKAAKDKAEYDMYATPLDKSAIDLPKPEIVWDDDLAKELEGK